MTTKHEQVTVGLEALRADATDWDHAARDLRVAARYARAATVPAPAFSFAGHGAAVAYEALRAATARLLDGGADNFAEIAAALREAARTYEADEVANAHRLRNVY